MNFAQFHSCKAGGKSPFFPQWEVAGVKQSLGSKNNGINVKYISAIIFISLIPKNIVCAMIQ